MPTKPVLATNNPEILLNRIKQEFPEITWSDYKFINVGWDHEVVQLDNEYIFRFPNSHEYLPVLRGEIELLEYLGGKTKARIPSYEFVAKDFSFGGYKILPGKELSLELFTSLYEGQQDIIAKDIADFLSDLHSIPVKELERFSVGSEKPFGGYEKVDELAVKYLKPTLSAEEYDTVTEMVADINRVKRYRQPACLTHGDIAPKHLIWDDPNEIVGFIDFSDRSISDPAIDFAELYTYGEKFVDLVYKLYRGPDKHPQFLTRAKAYMKAIGVNSLVNVYRTDRIKSKEAMQLLGVGADLKV
jgi:aminoglycoside 2''-phosphotransferase